MNNPANEPVNEQAIRSYRLSRVRDQLARRDLAGIVVFDPVNLRYATGSRNMQVWTMHNLCRYAFIATDGPVILFDLASSKHLAADLETVNEVRPSLAWDYMMVADRNDELARRWADEIADLLQQYGAGNRRLALDRADWLAVRELQRHGLALEDGKAVMEHARAIKSPQELVAMRYSYDVCEQSIADLKASVTPGMRENEALGILLNSNISRGGEYPETRLLTSGPRTNPWFQETGDRVMEAGDFLSFDTDLIGPYGFYTDISRSWVVGGGMPSDEQRRLYEQSVRQLEHNIALLHPGLSFSEYAGRSYKLPEEFLRNRYADVAHGCGLGVEYPLIWYPEDEEFGAYDGLFETNMVVCVESYVGAVGGREGVKLEQPVMITETGPELFIRDCPLEDHFL